MNILEQEDYIKGAPDEMLVGLAQMPTGQFPEFLIVSEIQRRQKMRQSYAASQETPQSTVTDQVVSQAVAEMPPQPMAPPMEMAPPPYETRVVQRGGRRIRKPVRREEQIVGEGIASLNANPDELMNAAMGVPMEEPVRMNRGGKTVQELQALVASGQISEMDKARLEELLRAAGEMEAMRNYPRLSYASNVSSNSPPDNVMQLTSLVEDLEKKQKMPEYFTNTAVEKDARKITDAQKIDPEIQKAVLAPNVPSDRLKQSFYNPDQANTNPLMRTMSGVGMEPINPLMTYNQPVGPIDVPPARLGQVEGFLQEIERNRERGKDKSADIFNLGITEDADKSKEETLTTGTKSKDQELADEINNKGDQNIYSLEDRQSQFGIVGPPAPQGKTSSGSFAESDSFYKPKIEQALKDIKRSRQELDDFNIESDDIEAGLEEEITYKNMGVDLSDVIGKYKSRLEKEIETGRKDAVNFAIAQLGASYAKTGNIGEAVGESAKVAMALKDTSKKRSDALFGLATEAEIKQKVNESAIGLREAEANQARKVALAGVRGKQLDRLYNATKDKLISDTGLFTAIAKAKYQDAYNVQALTVSENRLMTAVFSEAGELFDDLLERGAFDPTDGSRELTADEAITKFGEILGTLTPESIRDKIDFDKFNKTKP